MDLSKKMGHSSLALVKLYNETNSGHFFDKSTMKFFKSRVSGEFKRIDDKTAYFITTEQGPVSGSKRLATVRKATIEDFRRDDGRLISKVNIETVGEFNRLTMSQAKKVLRGL